jgi:hypothetical protein
MNDFAFFGLNRFHCANINGSISISLSATTIRFEPVTIAKDLNCIEIIAILATIYFDQSFSSLHRCGGQHKAILIVICANS